MAKQIKSRIIKSELYSWKQFEFLQHAEFKDISKEQFQKIKQSILKNDFVESFKAWKKGKKVYCLDGFHRCKALEMLEQEGYDVPEKMPTDFLDCKNKKEAAKLVAIYSSIYARVTDEGLYKFLHDYELDFDNLKAEIGIPNIDLDSFQEGYFDEPNFSDEAADQIPEEVEPVAKTGDLYLLGGKHRLFCGDCTVKENVEYLMNGEKADMVFTDPPYGMFLDTDYTGLKWGDRKGKKYKRVIGDNEDFKPELILSIFENYDYCEEMFLWGADYYYELIPNFKQGNYIVWDKTLQSNGDAGSNSEYELLWSKQKHKRKVLHFNWFRYFGLNTQDVNERIHPTQKPLEILKYILENYSKEKNKIIVDVFAGSGSTLIACEQTDRICYGMEIDPHYCDVIIQRYKDLTGKEVELVENVQEKKEAV